MWHAVQGFVWSQKRLLSQNMFSYSPIVLSGQLRKMDSQVFRSVEDECLTLHPSISNLSVTYQDILCILSVYVASKRHLLVSN